MTGEIAIRQATSEDADSVGRLVYSLIREIVPEFNERRSVDAYSAIAKNLMADSPRVWAFVGSDSNGSDIALLTLHECAAIYAEGIFGEISELYVTPDFRSGGVGAKLIDAAVTFAKQRGWSVLEVGAPDVPRWQKTVDFYRSYGFEMVGPRLELDL
ncbi:MAG: GNAT family N-acetyltransferase [Pseudomonadota bacterium]